MSQKPNTSAETSQGKAVGSNYLKLQQSLEVRRSLQGISQLLNTGLNTECLNICIKLIEAGVHPQALSEIVSQIHREIDAYHRINAP